MKWLALLLLTMTPAAAAQPFARAAVEGGDGIVPGQQVHVIIDVFAPDFFTSPPQFPLFDLLDALVTLPDDRAQNMMQTVDGQQYSGIRRIYAVVPERAGSFTIPPIRIPLGWSVDGKPMLGDVVTSPVAFQVDERTSVVFAAKGLTITQSFDRQLSSLKVGDALVRTIVVTAAETQGITMPPVDVGAATGLRQYVKPPKIEDRVPLGRGDTATRRTETVVYTADKVGGLAIPAVSYPWFDIDARVDEAATLPAVAVTVAAAAPRAGISIEDEKAAREPIAERRMVALGILLLLAIITFAWALRPLPHQAALVWRSLKARHLNSRRYRVRCLRRTIRNSDSAAIYAALHGWAHSEGHRTLSDWVAGRPPALGAEVASLERGLFGGGDDIFDRRALASLLDRHAIEPSARPTALPPLNPI